MSNYIPNGRTSLIKKGNTALQVQTEYAYRPYPRLTTTISTQGQVLHKIEKKLERAIETYDEQSKVESLMKQQHAEILRIVKEGNGAGDGTGSATFASSTRSAIGAHDTVSPEVSMPEEPTFVDGLREIPGVHYVYTMDNTGRFLGQSGSEHFKSAFPDVYKSVAELIQIFGTVPGVETARERGVVEIQKNRLYLVSTGERIYFATVDGTDKDRNYEREIKQLIESFFSEFRTLHY